MLRRSTRISELPRECFDPLEPFLSYEFWSALEDCGLIGANASFKPHFLWVDAPKPAWIPLFERSEHFGEYVFDHMWAELFHRFSVSYYPRLVCCIPYTPVEAPKILGPGANQHAAALLAELEVLAAELGASSVHGLFWRSPPKDLNLGWFERYECQFQWINKDSNSAPYASFDAFLDQLTSKKRRSIRSERAKISAQGVQVSWCTPKGGAVLSGVEQVEALPEDWEHFYACYVNTYAERGRAPYLSFGFFMQLVETMPKQLALCVAKNAAGNRVAAALFFMGANTLYGRYWGALEQVSCLHFELCYYQGVQLSIGMGFEVFDPGTQGEHKLIRGFEPKVCRSFHKVYDARFAEPIQQYCKREREHVQAYFEAATRALPFKKPDLSQKKQP